MTTATTVTAATVAADATAQPSYMHYALKTL
jgi:hypothetical protein